MNRLDAYRSLWATIPHVGRRWPVVGLAVMEGEAWTYGSDGYTVIVTRKPADPDLYVDCHLAKSEAVDLARALRPKNKAQEAETVRLMSAPGELHVKVESVLNDKDGGDTAVYDKTESDLSLALLLNRVASIWDWSVDTRPHVYNPDLYGRFCEAKNSETDYMTFWARTSPDGRLGVGVIAIGEATIGACLGLDRAPAVDVLRSFLDDKEVAA